MAGPPVIPVYKVPTPDRRTSLALDPSEPALIRPAWSLQRRSAQIGQFAQQGVGTSEDVEFLPSGVWSLKSLQSAQTFEIEMGAAADSPIIIEPSEVTIVGSLKVRLIQRVATDLDGVDITGVAAQDKFFEKSNAAGATWADELAADAAVFPKAVEHGKTGVSMDRVLSGKVSYPPNTGYCLRFQSPAGALATPDVIATFYFGGPVNTQPAHPGAPGIPAGTHIQAGWFAATLYGDGSGELRERILPVAIPLNPSGWQLVQKFRYATQGTAAGTAHKILFIPHGQNRIEIISGKTEKAAGSERVIGTTMGSNVNPNATSHHSVNELGEYGNKERATGVGPVRFDQRRDLRFPFQISWLSYPPLGTLVDDPFEILRQIPVDTRIFVRLHGDWVPRPPTDTPSDQTWISPKLYHADTKVALTPAPDGSFLAPAASKNRYYATFDFHTRDKKRTPILRGYDIIVLASTEMRIRTAVGGGFLERVSVNAGSGDPSQDNAQITIQDFQNQLASLRERGRRRAQIRIYNGPPVPDSDDYSIIMDGELPEALSKREGKAEDLRAPLRHKYEAPMIGMWARVSDQVNFQLRDFAEDLSGPINPQTFRHDPWKITDIVKWMFTQGLGFPETMLDIPDIPTIRAVMSGLDPHEYFIQPGADPLEFLSRMVRDYLGRRLLWDANAGPYGMWRVLAPPQPPYNVLYHFVSTHPGAGKLPHIRESYPANTFFCESYTSWVKPPEVNDITVTATGELLPNSQGVTQINAHLWNPHSYNPNGTEVPEHPDKLDRYVPFVYFNHHIVGATPKEAKDLCARLCRIIYARAATAQKWFRLRVPLVLVTVPGDTHQTRPRPLRNYDVISLNGHNLVVQSNQITIEHDHVQWSEIEALSPTNTVVIPP